MEFGLVALWLALYLGLGLLALPAASLAFAPLTDRGAGLAIPLSFGVLAVGAYWIGQVRFGPVAAFGALGLLAMISGVALLYGVDIELSRYRDAAVVFVLAYLLLILIRAFKPGVWPGGGEKFLDFGLLASLVRATSLPPQDVWFANEPVKYYYGGHMLAAVFSLLTDTAPRYAYNTAISGYYAAYVTAAWGLAGAIAAGAGRSYRVAGGLTAFFVGIASNLSPPLRLLIWALPDPAGSRLAALASLEVRGLANGPLEFNYWFASRIIDWKVLGGEEWHLINEFPFFAFLNGDLHAHMMSPVFLLLATGFAYSYWRSPGEAIWRRRLLVFGAIPLIAGILLVVNTWSFPAVVGIAWLTLLFGADPPWKLLPRVLSERIARWSKRDWRIQELTRLGIATGLAIVIAAIGTGVALPFLLGTASGRGIGFLPVRSDLPGLLVVHGTFLAISGAFLTGRLDWKRSSRVGLALSGLLLVTWLLDAAAVALFAPLLAVGWYLLRKDGDVDYETVLLVGVLGLLLLVEFVYVMEEAGPGRSNTVFKIYTQVWALWSVGAGAMAAWFFTPRESVKAFREVVRDRFGRLRDWLSSSGRSGETAPINTDGGDQWPKLTRGQVGTLLLVVAIVSLSIYAVLSLGWVIETGTDEPTLDSQAYIENRHQEEAAGIEWLSSLEGQPTMVSAPGVEIYQWVNGPSSMTGIPTVAGWAHEIGYRGEEPYRGRVHDVEILFETREATSRAILLEKYDVEYIYVGPIERERYDIRDYDSEPGITVAYTDDNVTIYRVESDELTG